MNTVSELVNELQRKKRLGSLDSEKVIVLIETREKVYKSTANLKSWLTPSIFERFARRFARRTIDKIIISK